MLDGMTARPSGPARVGRRVPARAAGVAAAAIIVCVVASGCGGSSSKPSAANVSGSVVSGPGGTVTIRSIDDVDTFNPGKTSAPNLAVQAMYLTYDRLVYLTPSYKLEPYLASSWTTTPNSVTFKIRPGATCDDGTPVTASVVANSLRYEFATSTKGPYLADVTGPGKLKSVTSAGDTVTVTLTKPYNALVTAFATPFATAIICPAGVAHPNSLNAAPDGSGPYVLDKSRSVRGSMYVFTLRKGYNWGPGGWSSTRPGVATTIIERVVTDETTAANLFTTGEVDITPVFGINEPRVAADRSAYTFTTQSLQMASWGTVFNQNAGRPGADPMVRHAAFLALDGPSMNKAAFSTEGAFFNTMVTPNMQCYNPAVGSSVPGFDPAQARSILEQDGYRPGSGGVMTKNGKPLTLHIVMWNTTNQLGDLMQAELRNVGIASTVQNTDISTWLTALFTTKNYDLSVYAYYSSFPNPAIIPDQDTSLSFNDPTYFSLVAAAEEAPPAAQCGLWDKALERAGTNYDVKPIGVSKNFWFGRGWKFAAPFVVNFDPFTLEKTK